ncbi:MAG: hypothetical protein ACK4QP_02640 [Pseudorhizobium sp.]
MGKRNAYGLTLATAVVALTAATSAMPQGYGPWSGRGMGPEMMNGGSRALIIDQNDDGRISDEEAAAASHDMFVMFDADDDDEITKEEYLALRMGNGPGWNSERQAAMQAKKEARFAEMDTDKSCSISRIEFLDTAKAHHRSADTDGDSVISPWEHRQRSWF